MNGHDDAQVMEFANQPDEDELQPTNCYECKDSHIEYRLTEDDKDYDVCACYHPDFNPPPVRQYRWRKVYSTPSGKWLMPGPYEIPGDRQMNDFGIGLPTLCPLRPEN